MRKVMLCFGLCAALLLCCACESEEEGIFDGFKSLDLPVDEETAAAIYYDQLEPEDDPQIQAALELLEKK